MTRSAHLAFGLYLWLLVALAAAGTTHAALTRNAELAFVVAFVASCLCGLNGLGYYLVLLGGPRR